MDSEDSIILVHLSGKEILYFDRFEFISQVLYLISQIVDEQVSAFFFQYAYGFFKVSQFVGQ